MPFRLLNMGIRAISMLSKFLLIVYLAKLLPTADLGIYGLLVASIGFAVLFLGFDYYTYSNRELLSVSKDEWSSVIVNQIYAYLPLYVIFIPIAFLLYFYDVLPNGYFIWFLLLLLLEHISIEQNRLLNTMQKQLSASFVLFFRSGLWVLFVMPLIIYIEKFRTLEVILNAWLLGVLFSVVFATVIIKKSINNWNFSSLSFSWIKKGYKVGVLFIVGTIALRAISTGDRFFLEQWSNVEMVGVYVFYTSLTVGASAFIHAGVIVFSTPKIITAYQQDKLMEFELLMNKFFKELIFSIIIMLTVLYLVMPFVIEWIGKGLYLEYYDVFYIALITVGVTVLSSHPGTYLYAARRDIYILLLNISSLIVFILLLWFFYFNYLELPALYRVSFSVALTLIFLLVAKYFGYFYFRKKMESKA